MVKSTVVITRSIFRNILAASLFFAALVSAPARSIAEDPERGRLADGRAFRTDDQGNQLVDYIAELEVNVESLERQVRGLEDENREKQAVIGRLQKGEKAEGNLVERSIQPGSGTVRAAAQQMPECKPQVIEKKCICPSAEPCAKADCSAESRRCEEQVEDLKVDHQVALSERTKEIKQLREQVDNYEAQLVSLKDELESESGRKAEFEGQLAALKRERDSSKEEIVRLQAKANAVQHDDVRGALKSDIPVEPVTAAASNSSGLRETRIQAVDMLRSKMLIDLNSLQGLVNYRETLSQDLRRRGLRTEDFSHSSSEVRESIARFRGQINSAGKVHELSAMRGSINELRGSVQGEIASLKRLEKSR